MEANPCLANALTLREATEDLHRAEMDIDQANIAAELAKEMSPAAVNPILKLTITRDKRRGRDGRTGFVESSMRHNGRIVHWTFHDDRTLSMAVEAAKRECVDGTAEVEEIDILN